MSVYDLEILIKSVLKRTSSGILVSSEGVVPNTLDRSKLAASVFRILFGYMEHIVSLGE